MSLELKQKFYSQLLIFIKIERNRLFETFVGAFTMTRFYALLATDILLLELSLAVAGCFGSVLALSHGLWLLRAWILKERHA